MILKQNEPSGMSGRGRNNQSANAKLIKIHGSPLCSFEGMNQIKVEA